MGENYALTVLKLEKQRVEKRSNMMVEARSNGSRINEPELTKCKHQLYALDYSIELLSDHFNDEA